jgi:hypothetical protein
MARSNFSPDALIEILSLCEQTLVALKARKKDSAHGQQLDKPGHSRRQKRANSRQFVLIQGGLSAEAPSSGSV